MRQPEILALETLRSLSSRSLSIMCGIQGPHELLEIRFQRNKQKYNKLRREIRPGRLESNQCLRNINLDESLSFDGTLERKSYDVKVMRCIPKFRYWILGKWGIIDRDIFAYIFTEM